MDNVPSDTFMSKCGLLIFIKFFFLDCNKSDQSMIAQLQKESAYIILI